MKKIILLLTIVLLAYVSSTALEPVRIGLNYPTGANFRVQLKDYTNPATPLQIFPATGQPPFSRVLSPNSSGVVSFVVGEGDPDWGGILPSTVNSSYVIDVRVLGVLVAQFNLLEMITTQATTGNGNILNDGFSSSGGVTFPDTTNLTNDFVFGSIKLDRTSSVPETKFFFDHSKSAFRTGVVNTDSWNEPNIGEFSFAAGKDNKATGKGAVAFGEGTSAPSYGEFAIGSYNTTYVPGDATGVDTNDRAFVIGNGTLATPSDAFIIKKNGNMTVGGTLTVLGATITNSNLNVGGTSISPSTGNLIVAGTSTLNGNVSVTGANTLTVGTGLTSLGGGLTVAGAVTLPAGSIQDSEVDNNITIDNGTVDNTPVGATTASTGAFTTLTATTATTTGLITAGNAITATTGNITATAGNVVAVDGTFSGDVTGVDGTFSGDVSGATVTTTGLITAGNAITATTGNITATAGNVVAVDGTFSGDVSGVKGTFSSDVAGVKGTFSGDVSGATVTTTGLITAGNAITATTGNITATAGNVVAVDGTFSGDVTGATATTTGLITAGNAITATTGNITATAGNIVAVDGTFSGDVSGVKGTFSGDVAGVKGTFSGAVTGATATTTGLVTAGNGLTVTTGATTLTSLATANNQSLYIDNAGVVTASNGAAARQASGIYTATASLTGGAATEAISDVNVTATSVIIITYFGAVNEYVRITAQAAGTFTVSTEGSNFLGTDQIHYMIINN